jgi:glyoxylase-like metal-dependent hydrolase (beta-lactamase superfamily II)
MDGATQTSLRGRLTSHCLLLETDTSLVLVDTGYGLRDVRDPRSRLAKFFLALVKPELREEMTAIRQIERMGFDARDVRHIVLSHLDFDHAGGLDDFPEATVHLLADEVSAASARHTLLDRMRYRPQQWGTRSQWQTHAVQSGESWFGFDRVRELAGLGPDVLMVPLIGHTLGHAGVAVRQGAGWLFYAADAYFFHAEMDLQNPRCTPGLAAYQIMMEKDRPARLSNQERLRELRRSHGEVSVFCAHDVQEFERLAGRSHRVPVSARARPDAGQQRAVDGRAG